MEWQWNKIDKEKKKKKTLEENLSQCIFFPSQIRHRLQMKKKTNLISHIKISELWRKITSLTKTFDMQLHGHTLFKSVNLGNYKFMITALGTKHVITECNYYV